MKILANIALMVAVGLCVASCNTGIESTKTIKMTKEDRRELAPTPEQLLMADVASAPLGSWREGKRFVVTDDKASLVLELPQQLLGADSVKLSGRVLEFHGVSPRLTPGGSDVAMLEFKSDGMRFRYNTSKPFEEAKKSVTGLDLPMMVDLDLVAEVDSLLRGRQLWILTPLWRDAAGNPLHGRKYVPVTVREVIPGDMVFPLLVHFDDENAHPGYIHMNVKAPGGSGAESRLFHTLFSMSDPKTAYPAILPEVWTLIQRGVVRPGMTKLECKLSLGNPNEVDSGHNWDSLLDIWSYQDGTFLRFQDGLLIDYRR